MQIFPYRLDAFGNSPWGWSGHPGWNGCIWGVIHATASPGSDARDVYNYFMGNNSMACAHFVIGKLGEVFQCKDPNDSAAANCCPSTPSPMVDWCGGTNANWCTWAIEFNKQTSDNSEPLTEAQYQSGLSVIKWLCDVCGTARRPADANGGIMTHSFLDPVHRPGGHCPGTFDWDRLWSDLAGSEDVFSNGLCISLWESNWKAAAKPIPPRDTGIFKSWRELWIGGQFKGCCLSPEYPVTLPNGHAGVAQNFAGGTCVWDNVVGSATWL